MKRPVIAAMAAAILLCACGPQPADMAEAGTELPEQPGLLELSVLDSVSPANTALVDSAVCAGNAYDLAVAFHYYFHMSATDRSMTRRAIEIYDKLKASSPDSYGSVLYDVSKDLERLNYGRMVDRHVDYLRSVGGYEPADSVASVSR